MTVSKKIPVGREWGWGGGVIGLIKRQRLEGAMLFRRSLKKSALLK